MLRWLGLPQPETFADGQRQFFGVAMVLAGIFAGVISIGMVGLFTAMAIKYPAMMKLCLYILAGGFAGFLTSMIAVIIAMAVGGPVGRFKTKLSREGAELEAEGDS